jgi:hypothetical protein
LRLSYSWLFVTTAAEISRAVRRLPRRELKKFHEWFVAYDAATWDQQFERDVAAGRLDRLAREALRDLRGGRCSDL